MLALSALVGEPWAGDWLGSFGPLDSPLAMFETVTRDQTISHFVGKLTSVAYGYLVDSCFCRHWGMGVLHGGLFRTYQ